MRHGNPAEGVDRWIIVEHDAAAAVDLEIHIARRQEVARQIDHFAVLWNSRFRSKILWHGRLRKRMACPGPQSLSVENTSVPECHDVLRHVASATILRCRATSGSVSQGPATSEATKIFVAATLNAGPA